MRERRQQCSSRMRIVLDTNVVLSALLWTGTPHHLLQAIGRQRATVQLYSSTALIEELANVLGRPSAASRLALIGQSARQTVADYIDVVELVAPVSVPRVVPDDADDDHVIAAALAAQADLIVSGDRHLLSIGHHQGVAIVMARGDRTGRSLNSPSAKERSATAQSSYLR